MPTKDSPASGRAAASWRVVRRRHGVPLAEFLSRLIT
jgi:hypothetical protein